MKMTYEVQLPEGISFKEEALDRVRREAVVERDETGKRMELEKHINRMSMKGQVLEIEISMTEEGSVRPREVLECLGINDPITLHVRRTHIEFA
jgi:hypothetical protein